MKQEMVCTQTLDSLELEGRQAEQCPGGVSVTIQMKSRVVLQNNDFGRGIPCARVILIYERAGGT